MRHGMFDKTLFSGTRDPAQSLEVKDGEVSTENSSSTTMEEDENDILNSENENTCDVNFVSTKLQLDYTSLSLQQNKSENSKKIRRASSRYGLAPSSERVPVNDDVLSLSQSLKSEDADIWTLAICAELESPTAQNTRVVVQRPEVKKSSLQSFAQS